MSMETKSWQGNIYFDTNHTTFSSLWVVLKNKFLSGNKFGQFHIKTTRRQQEVYTTNTNIKEGLRKIVVVAII